jgi:hypothetical protein
MLFLNMKQLWTLKAIMAKKAKYGITICMVSAFYKDCDYGKHLVMCLSSSSRARFSRPVFGVSVWKKSESNVVKNIYNNEFLKNPCPQYGPTRL